MGYRAEVARRGFTLLELIVTLFVVGLAAAVVAPAIGRSAESLQARADVAGFLALLRHAREQAITTGLSQTVVVDPAQRRVVVQVNDMVREMRVLPARVQIQAEPPPALSVRFDPQGLSSGGQFRLVSGAVTYVVTIDAVTGRVRSARR